MYLGYVGGKLKQSTQTIDIQKLFRDLEYGTLHLLVLFLDMRNGLNL